MSSRARRGFTLIELLIVIVIIALLAALLLPALLKALCNARAGAAKHLIDQMTQATKSYELDWAVFPPGNGSGSKELVYYLQQKGPKKLAYFEFPVDLLDTGNVINPVWGQAGQPPSNWIYYQNNAAGGAAGAGGVPLYNRSSFQIWCAGCDFGGGTPQSIYSINNWN